MKRASTRLFPLFALTLLALGAGACSSYSYYDLDIKFGTGLDVVTIGSIQHCQVTVSGAANDVFEIDPNNCKLAKTGEVGMVEYSTFADSGNLTFTLHLFQAQENTACLIGEGAVTLPAGTAVRRTGTLTATAPAPENPGGATCQ